MSRKAIFLAILPLLFASCGEEIPEPYSYDPELKFREEERLPLSALGLEGLTADEVLPVSYQRNDGSLDPFKGKKPAKVPNLNTHDEEWLEKNEKAFAPIKAMFPDDLYEYYPWTMLYLDRPSEPTSLFPCFYDRLSDGPWVRDSHWPNPFIDAVYSHGVWSYINNSQYMDYWKDNIPILMGRQVFAMVEFCTLEEFPYRVYFDDKAIYFMNRDEDFSNAYLKYFNENENMHLFLA